MGSLGEVKCSQKVDNGFRHIHVKTDSTRRQGAHMGSELRIGIIGCGLIGTKRAKHIINASVVACADHVMEKSIALASSFAGCQALSSWQSLIAMPDIDVVIVATPHHMLAPVAISAIKTKKHLLIEKPGARTSSEILPLIKLAKENNVIVHVGFNHGFHQALQKAHDLVQSGALGELMFIRGVTDMADV